MPQNITKLRNNQKRYVVTIHCKPNNLISNINKQINKITNQNHVINNFSYQLIHPNTYQLSFNFANNYDDNHFKKMYKIIYEIMPPTVYNYNTTQEVNDCYSTLAQAIVVDKMRHHKQPRNLIKHIKQTNTTKIAKNVDKYLHTKNKTRKLFNQLSAKYPDTTPNYNYKVYLITKGYLKEWSNWINNSTIDKICQIIQDHIDESYLNVFSTD